MAVALVNIGEGVVNIKTTFVDLGLSAAARYDVLDVFAHGLRANVAVGFTSTIPAYVKHNKEPTAGAVLYLLTPSDSSG